MFFDGGEKDMELQIETKFLKKSFGVGSKWWEGEQLENQEFRKVCFIVGGEKGE